MRKHSYIEVVLCLLFLSGCGTKTIVDTQKDGAPKHIPKHLDKIKNAVPKVEPLSRYGNRFKNNSNSYVALKKRYTVMKSSRGYHAKGLASWYGTKFHGRKTSSGEPYDMYAMTAAHRTLPLPTYAKVTNLSNGRCIIVKVNDRGPFHKNRIIDLSYAAAHKLGVLGNGTAHVEVESIDPRDHGGRIPSKTLGLFAKRKAADFIVEDSEALQTAQSSVHGNKSLYLQVGAFSQKALAEKLRQDIARLSQYPSSITTAQTSKSSSYNSKKPPLFKVRLGPFHDQQALQQAKTVLQRSNIAAVECKD